MSKYQLKGHKWESINRTMQYRCKHCGIIKTQTKDGPEYQSNDGKKTLSIPDCVERVDNSEFYQ